MGIKKREDYSIEDLGLTLVNLGLLVTIKDKKVLNDILKDTLETIIDEETAEANP